MQIMLIMSALVPSVLVFHMFSWTVCVCFMCFLLRKVLINENTSLMQLISIYFSLIIGLIIDLLLVKNI